MEGSALIDRIANPWAAHALLGTPHMDGNTRLCTATSAQAMKESFARFVDRVEARTRGLIRRFGRD